MTTPLILSLVVAVAFITPVIIALIMERLEDRRNERRKR